MSVVLRPHQSGIRVSCKKRLFFSNYAFKLTVYTFLPDLAKVFVRLLPMFVITVLCSQLAQHYLYYRSLVFGQIEEAIFSSIKLARSGPSTAAAAIKTHLNWTLQGPARDIPNCLITS